MIKRRCTLESLTSLPVSLSLSRHFALTVCIRKFVGSLLQVAADATGWVGGGGGGGKEKGSEKFFHCFSQRKRVAHREQKDLRELVMKSANANESAASLHMCVCASVWVCNFYVN